MRFGLVLVALSVAACKTLPGVQTPAAALSAQCQQKVCHHVLQEHAVFTGILRNGVPDGEGKYRNNQRDITYTGAFAQGRFDGEGVLITPTSIFSGTFRAGEPVSGELATSGLKLDIQQREGQHLQARYELEDGTRGSGKFSLQRIETLDVGSVEMAGLQQEGPHSITYANGESYQAQYLAGVQTGTALWRSADGKQDRVEQWENGKRVNSRPGPIALKARAAACKIKSASESFAWFGKDCKNGWAQGNGIAYAVDGDRTLAGEFQNGQLVKGSDEQGATLLQGQFRNLKLHGEGQWFQSGELLFSGQFINGEKGKGQCLVEGRLITCDHYEGARIIEEQELSSQHQLDIAAEQSRAQRLARNAYASLNQLRSEADDTFNQRDSRWQREREQEATSRANNQAMNNAFKKFNADLENLAEQNRQFNQNLAQQQAKIQAQQAPKRDYYAESLQRIASQQNQQKIVALQQPAVVPAPAASGPDPAVVQEARCKEQGGTYNKISHNCVINRSQRQPVVTVPAKPTPSASPSPAVTTVASNKGYEGCYGAADHRRGRGNCIKVVEESFKDDCSKGRRLKIRLQNTCDYRVVTNIELKTTRQYPSSAQFAIKPGGTNSWDTCEATGEWGYEAWFSVKGVNDWLCHDEKSWINEPF